MLDGVRVTLPTSDATVQATVLSGARDVVWSSSSGPDPDGADRPFRMASVGKTITAATVLRLGELGMLDLDAPIAGLLDPDDASLLVADGYDLGSITPRQLLAHTSGVYDYAFGVGSTFLEDALADRTHRWTRREQLQLAVDAGDPLWGPGTDFAYSDTGYILLGEIIEQVTAEPYHVAARDLLGFDHLGLDHLWLETFEPAPVDLAPISRSFLVAEEVSDLDFSLDAYGGGGYAGTTADVARFLSALLGGEVFDDPTTLTAMLTIPATNVGREEFGVLLGDGGHGLYRIDVGGRVCWSHRGFLGTIVLACPDQDVTVVLTTNVAMTDPLGPAMQLVSLADPRAN